MVRIERHRRKTFRDGSLRVHSRTFALRTRCLEVGSILEGNADDLVLATHRVGVRRRAQRVADREWRRIGQRQLVTKLENRTITLAPRGNEASLRISEPRLCTRDVE